MTLRGRILRLEYRKAPPVASDANRRVAEKLARMETAVIASGDASDRPKASLIERTVRRYIRGDAGMGDALRDLVVGIRQIEPTHCRLASDNFVSFQ